MYFVLVAFLSIWPVSCYRILAIFPHVSKSHLEAYRPLLEELAGRGHQLTVVSFFPRSAPLSNYSDISLEGLQKPAVDSLEVGAVRGLNPVADYWVISGIGLEGCEAVLGWEPLRALARHRYHLVLVELFTTDCFLPLVDLIGAPFIGVSSSSLFPTTGARVGEPEHPAYAPHMFSGYGPDMSFYRRTANGLISLAVRLAKRFYFDPLTDRIASKYLGPDVRPVEEIAAETCLVFAYGHFTINGPRPHQPAVVEIAGLHITPPKPIPPDLETFIGGSERGLIYFSLGSILLGKSLTEVKRRAFVEAFSRLEQRVLWKYEDDWMPDKPENVLIAKWFPQRDILERKEIKLVISHGGMLTLTEAVHCGVPVLGIPMYGDQATNLAGLERTGSALVLNYESINAETLLNTINRILNDTRFQENATALSKAFKDRPTSPMDLAVFWTEYVARYGGAPYAKSPARHLNWFQLSLIDITLAVLCFLISLIYSIYLAAVTITNFLLRRIILYKVKVN